MEPLLAQLEALKGRGNEAFTKKHFESAIASYTEGLEANDASPAGEDCPSEALAKHRTLVAQLYGNRSAALAELKRFEEAFADAEKAVATDPSWPKGYVRKAAACKGLGRFDDAVEALEKARSLDSSDKGLKRLLEEAKALASDAEKVQPLASIDKLMKLFKAVPKGDPRRLCFLATTWNLLTVDLRWAVFKRFLLVIGGPASVDETLVGENIPIPHISRFTPEGLTSLPMENYAGVKVPDNWLAFVRSLAAASDVSIVDLFNACWEALDAAEQRLVIEDIRTFFTLEGRQAAASGGPGYSAGSSSLSSSASTSSSAAGGGSHGRIGAKQGGKRHMAVTNAAATITAGDGEDGGEEYSANTDEYGSDGDGDEGAIVAASNASRTVTVSAKDVARLLNRLGVGVPKPVDSLLSAAPQDGPVRLPDGVDMDNTGAAAAAVEAKGQEGGK